MPITRGLVKPMIVQAIQLNTVKLNKQWGKFLVTHVTRCQTLLCWEKSMVVFLYTVVLCTIWYHLCKRLYAWKEDCIYIWKWGKYIYIYIYINMCVCVCVYIHTSLGLPVVKNPPVNAGDVRAMGSWVRKIPWRTAQQPTSGSLPGESHVPRRLAGYSP